MFGNTRKNFKLNLVLVIVVVLDTAGLYFGALWTGIRTVAELNKYERGLEPTETEVNL